MATAAEGRRQGRLEDTPGGERLIPPLRTIARMMLTFMLVCACWIFFRASSFDAAMFTVSTICCDAVSPSAYGALTTKISEDSLFKHAVVAIIVLVSIEWLQRRHPHPLQFNGLPRSARCAIYTVMLWGMLDCMKYSEEFIYFAF